MERRKNPSAFIRNTYTILERPDLNHIIAWNQGGNGFIIHDLPKFQSQILPQYFKHQKYTSFVRQLNMYGFHKQRHPLTQNYFQHESFRRGQSLSQIKRKPQKKKKSQEQSGIILINKYQEMVEQQNKQSQNEQNEQNIQSMMGINPPGSEQVWQKEKQSNKGEIDESQIRKSSCSIDNLCEKAIFQNQILTKMHEILLNERMKIKKIRYEWLKQNHNIDFESELNCDMSYLCQIIKTETMKLSAHLDLPIH